MTVLISKPFPLPLPLGFGSPRVGAGPPNAGTTGDVMLSLALTRPGDVSIALGSRILKRGWPELGRGPQFEEGHGFGFGL